MKLQIDTEKREVVIGTEVNVGELIIALEKFLGLEYRTFKISPKHLIEFYNPIYIPLWQTQPYLYPWYNGTVTSSGTIEYNSGVYNVECK